MPKIRIEPNLTKEANERQQSYFTSLAPSWGHLTGNTTRAILDQVLDEVPIGIKYTSLIHDNGCGPGTATAAVLDWCAARAKLEPKITATDVNSAMIDTIKARQSGAHDASEAGASWPTVTAQVMDSQKMDLPSDHFFFTFCNFCIATTVQPLRVLMEIHRTLRPTGIAVITCWKRFGVAEVMAKAEKKVKSDAYEGVMKEPGVEFKRDGFLAHMMYAADFETGKIKTLEKSVLVKEGSKEMEGLKEFLMGKWTEPARQDWSEEETSKWPAAVEEAIKEEVGEHGGVLMEAYVVLARKWDALSA